MKIKCTFSYSAVLGFFVVVFVFCFSHYHFGLLAVPLLILPFSWAYPLLQNEFSSLGIQAESQLESERVKVVLLVSGDLQAAQSRLTPQPLLCPKLPEHQEQGVSQSPLQAEPRVTQQ